MPSDDMSFIERMRGKRTHDINLPADESKRDPRLKGFEQGAVRKSLATAAQGTKTLQDLVNRSQAVKRTPGGRR